MYNLNILIAVESVLFDSKPERIALKPNWIAECRRLLYAIGEDRNLFAIWSTFDIETENKLEQSGLISYFKKCFVCDSFEKDFGKDVMSRDYYSKVLRKGIDECVGKSYADILFVSDYEGFYRRGSYYNTIYYDPRKMIHWERDSGYVAYSFDEIIEVVGRFKTTKYNKPNGEKL